MEKGTSKKRGGTLDRRQRGREGLVALRIGAGAVGANSELSGRIEGGKHREEGKREGEQREGGGQGRGEERTSEDGGQK